MILPDKSYLNRALEIFIHIGLVVLLAAACFLVLSPFIGVIAWGLTIAIAGYPAYRKLQKLLGGRGGLAAILFTVFLLTRSLFRAFGENISSSRSEIFHYRPDLSYLPEGPK